MCPQQQLLVLLCATWQLAVCGHGTGVIAASTAWEHKAAVRQWTSLLLLCQSWLFPSLLLCTPW